MASTDWANYDQPQDGLTIPDEEASQDPPTEEEHLGTTYSYRAWDSGTGGWVTWQSIGFQNPNPTKAQTSPNYTGVLSNVTVEVIAPVQMQ